MVDRQDFVHSGNGVRVVLEAGEIGAQTLGCWGSDATQECSDMLDQADAEGILSPGQ